MCYLRRLTLIAIVVASTSPLCTGQGFKSVYSLGYRSISFTGCLVDNDTLVIGGMAQKSADDLAGLILIKMDTLGNVIWAKQYLDSLGDHFVLELGYNITVCPDGGYALVGQLFQRRFGVLIKTDRDGNLEFLKEFVEDRNEIKTVHNQKVIALEDGGYIIAGEKQVQRGDLDVFVLRTDAMGDVLWEWRYDDNYQTDVLGSLVVQDSIIWIGAGTTELDSDAPFYDLWTKSWIRGLNMSGELIAEWTSEKSDSIAGVVGLNIPIDSGRIYLGARLVEHPGWTGIQPLVVRLNSNMQFEWVKAYGDNTSVANGLSDMQAAGEEEWICAGQEVYLFEDGRQGLPAWLMKIDSQGNVIWSRHDTISQHGHYLSSVAVMASGSIVAVGYLNLGGSNRGIVIKVDKDGCIDPGCRETSSNSTISFPSEKWMIYPNPTTNEVHIKSNNGPGPAVIRFFDTHGKLVCEEMLSTSSEDHTLSLAHLASGIYFYTIDRNGLLIDSGKLVLVK
jgi:Secretion system C-terminal sorting domain